MDILVRAFWWIYVCTSAGYTWGKSLGQRACVCSVLVDTAKWFSTMAVSMYPPAGSMTEFHLFRILATLAFFVFFNLTILVDVWNHAFLQAFSIKLSSNWWEDGIFSTWTGTFSTVFLGNHIVWRPETGFEFAGLGPGFPRCDRPLLKNCWEECRTRVKCLAQCWHEGLTQHTWPALTVTFSVWWPTHC